MNYWRKWRKKMGKKKDKKKVKWNEKKKWESGSKQKLSNEILFEKEKRKEKGDKLKRIKYKKKMILEKVDKIIIY